MRTNEVSNFLALITSIGSTGQQNSDLYALALNDSGTADQFLTANTALLFFGSGTIPITGGTSLPCIAAPVPPSPKQSVGVSFVFARATIGRNAVACARS